MQPEKPAPGMATPDFVMSQAEVERRGGAGVDSGHDLLLGNDGIGSTSTRQGTGHVAQGQGSGMTRQGVTRRGMGAPPRGDLEHADVR